VEPGVVVDARGIRHVDPDRLAPPEGRRLQEGDAVIAGFRIQAFVTRALVVGVKGIGAGNPVVSGIWNVDGAPADWGGR